MTEQKRQMRPPPQRTAPIRNKFASSARVDDQRVDDQGRAAFSASVVGNRAARKAKSTVKSADEKMRRTVERGVDTAYMVIEEYMRHGRQAAGRQQQRSATEGGEAKLNGQHSGSIAAGWKALAPLAAPLMQVLRQLTTGTAASSAGIAADWINQFVSGQASQTSQPAIAIQVSAQAQTEVTVQLLPGADAHNLSAEPLVHTDRQDAPPLVSLGLESKAGRVRVRLTVPNDQPAGTYAGALYDETGTKRGELRVEILPPPWRAARPSAKKKASERGAN